MEALHGSLVVIGNRLKLMVLVLGFELDLVVSSFIDDKQRNIERVVHLWILKDVNLLDQEVSRFQDVNLVSSKILGGISSFIEDFLMMTFQLNW